MEFINQVKQLKEQTKSPEVRQICEAYLSGKGGISPEAITNVLNENFVTPLSSPSILNYRDAVQREEAETSKRAADSLMASWDGVKSAPLNNSGTYLIKESQNNDNSIIREIASAASGDSSANSFVEAQGLKKLGVLESISKIKSSSIYEHHPVRVLCEKYSNLIENKNIPEFALIHNFIAEASNFKWDFTVGEVLTKLNRRVDKYSREIEVSKVLENVKSSGSSSFYSELTESLNSWLISESKSSGILSKSISKWAFNPVVRNLINYLNVNESRSSRNLEIPVSQGESTVNRVHSPVLIEEGNTIFAIGKTLFEASENGVSKIAQDRIQYISNDYLSLVSALNNEGVKVNENGVFVRFGKKTVRLVEENSDLSVYLDKTKLNFRSLGELGKLLGLEAGAYFGVNENETITNVITIYRGFNDIVELDFAKSIVSNIYEGVTANLIKWEGKIYLNRVNEGMRENSLFPVNGTQAVNMVKELLRYDISEGLTEFLEGEQKVKSVMINDRNKVLENISRVEIEMSKIETLMESNQLYANSKEIKAAHNLLNRELSLLKEKWNQINLEIAKIEMTPEIDEVYITEDERFHIGSYIKVKESGESGKIVSVDGTSGRFTVLLDSGKTSDYLVNEIVDLDSALNQAANDNEESRSDRSDEDGEEEMKESMTLNTLNKSKLSIGEQKKILKTLATNHSFANAPKGEQDEIEVDMDGFHGYNLTMNEAIKKIQSQYKNGQLVKAPGNDKMTKGKDANKKNLAAAPGSSKMVKGKEQGKNLLRDAPGKEGDVDFDGVDAAGNKYEIGYNIAEGKTTATNYAKTPNGGSKVKSTGGTTKNNTTAHAPESGKHAPQTKGTTPNNLAHAPENGKHAGETHKPALMNSLISAPDHGRKAKETNSVVAGITKKQGLVSAPGKEGNVNFKAAKDRGYNLSEGEELKKK